MGLFIAIGVAGIVFVIGLAIIGAKDEFNNAHPSETKQFLDSIQKIDDPNERALRIAEETNKQLRKDLHLS